MPAGDYTVEDVTGERPDLGKKADGGLMIKHDPAARQTRIDYQMSAQQLADAGLPCDIAPMQARVFVIRPVQNKVWVSIWKPSLASLARHPVTIAYGKAPEDKAGSESIRAAWAKLGVRSELVAASDVKRKKMVHEVRIKPTSSYRDYREDTSKWYLMDTFDNEVVDTTNSVVFVGSEDTNDLLKQAGKEGTFAYDKVLEKVTAKFPGAGRGVIGWIDAVNSPIYDTRSQTRDALYVGGSDAAGTQAAVKELVDLISRYGKPLPATPVASQPGATAAKASP